VRKLKIFFLAALAIGLVSVIGCSKKNDSTPAKSGLSDSIYYSPWITLSTKFVGVDPNTSDSAYGQTLAAKSVTRAIIDKGVVLTYIAQGVTNSGDTAISNAENYLNPILYVGNIDLYSNLYGDFTGVPFRYIVIPGNVLVTSSMKDLTLKQLKALSFTEVDAALKIAGKTASPVQLDPPQ
jgi:hypothetical protein